MGNDQFTAIETGEYTEISQSTKQCIPRSKLKKACHLFKKNKNRDKTLCIKLYGNRLGSKGAKYIAGLLPAASGLTTLHLPNNALGKDGILQLAQGLQHNNTVKLLDVSGNPCGTEGAKLFARILWGDPSEEKRNATLQVLGIALSNIGDEGFAAILSASSNLRVLSVGKNNITSEGFSNHTEELAKHKHLVSLAVHGTRLTCSARESLAVVVKNHKTLHEVVGIGEPNEPPIVNESNPPVVTLPVLEYDFVISPPPLMGDDISETSEETDTESVVSGAAENSDKGAVLGPACARNKTGTLRLVVQKAVDLLKADTFGASDPYVVMKTCGSEYKTTSKKKTLAPVWNEEFNFSVHLDPAPQFTTECVYVCNARLHFEVYDRDLLTKDEPMGCGLLHIDDLPHNFPVDRCVQLDTQGVIWVTVTALDFGLKANHRNASVSLRVAEKKGRGSATTIAKKSGGLHIRPHPTSELASYSAPNLEVLTHAANNHSASAPVLEGHGPLRVEEGSTENEQEEASDDSTSEASMDSVEKQRYGIVGSSRRPNEGREVHQVGSTTIQLPSQENAGKDWEDPITTQQRKETEQWLYAATSPSERTETGSAPSSPTPQSQVQLEQQRKLAEAAENTSTDENLPLASTTVVRHTRCSAERSNSEAFVSQALCVTDAPPPSCTVRSVSINSTHSGSAPPGAAPSPPKPQQQNTSVNTPSPTFDQTPSTPADTPAETPPEPSGNQGQQSITPPQSQVSNSVFSSASSSATSNYIASSSSGSSTPSSVAAGTEQPTTTLPSRGSGTFTPPPAIGMIPVVPSMHHSGRTTPQGGPLPSTLSGRSVSPIAGFPPRSQSPASLRSTPSPVLPLPEIYGDQTADVFVELVYSHPKTVRADPTARLSLAEVDELLDEADSCATLSVVTHMAGKYRTLKANPNLDVVRKMGMNTAEDIDRIVALASSEARRLAPRTRDVAQY
eukprot:TRINITY_DN54634_c0_g1_i1.p1 TRINITY_DN54634_c0_g1~~TRINITY_DN54634_c0_g1_i1.p1  ORF type:complete len:961 (-),score=113.14 TRINITY_DN54634_c0_g1_i1:1382-4264(-)